jgi:hypothetical protein
MDDGKPGDGPIVTALGGTPSRPRMAPPLYQLSTVCEPCLGSVWHDQLEAPVCPARAAEGLTVRLYADPAAE